MKEAGQVSFELLIAICGRETELLSLDVQRVLTQKGERVVRITTVNFFGNIVLDTLVKPWGKVLDYRESITNIRKQDLLHAPSFPKVVQIVSEHKH